MPMDKASSSKWLLINCFKYAATKGLSGFGQPFCFLHFYNNAENFFLIRAEYSCNDLLGNIIVLKSDLEKQDNAFSKKSYLTFADIFMESTNKALILNRNSLIYRFSWIYLR
jgi:hypothetical protein